MKPAEKHVIDQHANIRHGLVHMSACWQGTCFPACFIMLLCLSTASKL